MDTAIIIAIIVAVTDIIISIINNCKLTKQGKENKMFSAKQSILQMINEDFVAVELRNVLPTNHSRILYEYDIYKANGGNSDIDEKMEEYRHWYSSLNLKEE